MPKSDQNPGDKAADDARKADEQRQSDDARKAQLQAEAEANLRQSEQEGDRRRQASDAAEPEAVAAANLAANSHLSEAEARAEVNRSLASRDESAAVYQRGADPMDNFGVLGVAPPSPQNTVDNQGTPLGTSILQPRPTPAYGTMPMPPYSPQNRTKDGGEFRGDRDAPITLGFARPANAIAGDGENTIAMHFPRPLRLTLDDHSVVAYEGNSVHQVPEHIADHWYLRNSGATRVEDGGKK